MTLTKIFILILVVITAGCASQEVKPPEVVNTIEHIYVPIPEEFTKDCPIDNPQTDADYQPLGIKHIAELRADSLRNCNKDKEHIRNIQGTAVPQEKK